MKKALITGLTGQDGSYLAELLLKEGYEVAGMVRRSSTETYERIDHLKKDVELIQADLLDELSLIRMIEQAQPDEIYNLAAMSFVPTSWSQPMLTGEFTALGVTRMLDAMRRVSTTTKFYQASSSEMYGKVLEVPQSETTPFYPRSPYAVAKVYGHYITVNYRESYDLFAVSGILFNHESPRRGLEFVTRKITDGVARIKLGHDQELRLGNLDSKRDWGFAGDYVKAMWLMLQQDIPEDFVIATGQEHSVREFCDAAFSHVGLNYQDYVVKDPKFFRPAEVDRLIGDCSKAKKDLNWEPEVDFAGLVSMMVEADMKRLTDRPPSEAAMRVLVTGANGFVGRHLVATLEQGGHSPVLLDLTEAPFRAGLPYYRADLQDAGSLAAIVAESQPDACVHLAGLAFIPQADVDPALAFRVNTLGTVHVLDALRRHAPAARSLIVTSAQVYGLPVSNEPIPETAPLLPDNLYGVTKIAADHAALLYARTFDVPVMTARPNNHIGPGQSPQFVSSAFAQQLIEIQAGRMEPVMRTGNLASRRDFLDVRDVTRAYLAILEQGRPGEPYNIGTGTLTTIQTLLDELCDLCGVQPTLEIDPARFRPTDDGPVLDIAKITGDTGWTPQISLRQTLQDILADVQSTHS